MGGKLSALDVTMPGAAPGAASTATRAISSANRTNWRAVSNSWSSGLRPSSSVPKIASGDRGEPAPMSPEANAPRTIAAAWVSRRNIDSAMAGPRGLPATAPTRWTMCFSRIVRSAPGRASRNRLARLSCSNGESPGERGRTGTADAEQQLVAAASIRFGIE